MHIKAICIDSASQKRPSIWTEMHCIPHWLIETGKVEVKYLFDLWQNYQTLQPLDCHYNNSISTHTKAILLNKLLASGAVFAVIMICFPIRKLSIISFYVCVFMMSPFLPSSCFAEILG